MKIIAYGKKSIGDAVQTAEVALVLGVKSVVIEFVPAATVEAVSPGTLAFCPVTDCSECQAAPCPFGHKSGDKVADLKKEYNAAEEHLNDVARRLREAATHG
ncbi:hypothetical protein QQF21_17040 [Lelliottia sp. V89_10]|uniref:hypothetical protein n=1 Tax=Lelliottia wanjuensis TaxID=3050585 RepID=UPI00249E1937|nr:MULTISPECIES: hypothetical protein [unclassified Lelliottia]MDI3359739.1 hypothetical protein [Lelliottia sp. V89_13]MDK9548697.1 hypothetical protein [Lelliottia sp. V89_5]MDK9597329.1 hypothetical protein [Lelliottia sp. V89_10]